MKDVTGLLGGGSVRARLAVLEDAGRLRRETRPVQRARAAEVWIPVLAPVA